MSIRRHIGNIGLCLGVLCLAAAPALAQTVAFVDANGSPASTYLEKTRVHVRVEDPAANSQSWSVETVSVYLSAGLSGDSETLSLTETGQDTGVFEGSLPLDLNPSPYRFDILETSFQAGPPVVHDTLTAQYGSASDTAAMAAGRIELVDDLGRPASGYTQGDRVTVRVEDHLIYNDPGLRDGITVAVNVLAVSDEEFIVLYETGNATGIFEGSIPAVLHATYDSDGVVGAPVGNLVHAQYAIGTEEWLDASVPLVGSRAEILDRSGKPAEFVAESAPVRLRVVDGTIGGGSLVDTLQAEVSSLLGGDAETVALAETGADTGVYEAELPTAFNLVTPTSPGNGRLETGEDAGPPHRFDTITLSYDGPAGTSSDTAATYGSETFFVDEWGNGTEIYAVGSTVFIRVIDFNYDQSGARDTVSALVIGLARGDNEAVNLVETGSHTGVFEGSLPIQYGFYNVASYDGWLEADPGETIEVRHTDALGSTASADRAVIRYSDIHFFDEQGRPTHEVLEGGYASIRLYNFPGNNSPWDVDSTFVMVRSLLTGDVEFVEVTETARNTGIFEGRIRLVFSPSMSNGNGTLEVFNGGSPDYTQDTVTVQYSAYAQASATTVGARISLVDRYGQDAESFAVGDLVAVRVEDHNVDDPLTRQTLEAVIVVNSQAGDVEGVTVTETGYDTGVFVGSVPSRFSPSKTPNNHTLEVQDGDRLQARHVWQHAPRIATDDAVVTGSSVLFVDAQGQPAESYLEASRAYVRLVYAGGNVSPSVDSVAVTLSAAISPDSEVLTLTETGFDTGIFTGSIRLSVSGIGISPNDGTLQTGRRTNPLELDTLTVTHSRPGGSSTDTVALESSRTAFVDAQGNPADEYARGSRAYIRVEDHSFDRPGLYDTVQVTVRSLTTGDQENLTLLETSRDSGVFTGSLPLESSPYGQTYSNPGDGKLQSDAQEEIEATHDDGQGSVSTDRARIVYTSVEFIDAAGVATVEVLEGGLARLRVFDPYASNGNPVGVTVRSRYGNDQEYVSLTETSYQSHIFEGTIELRSVAPGNALVGNNILETSNSGSPEYRGDELTASYGGSTARAVTVPSRIRFIDGFGRVASAFAMGERAGIRVEDNNLDDPTVRRTISVQVRVQHGNSSDVDSVTLTETGFDTNVYEGSVLLSPLPYGGWSNDGELLVFAGDVVRAEHANMTTPTASVAEASVTGSQVLFVDANGQPAAIYLEGSRAWVRVVDLAANQTSSPDSVTVMLRTALGPDVEQLSLTETGGATGVFTGSIPLSVSSGLSPNDGRLTTMQDLGTPHEFDTLRAEYNGATVEIATIGTISSRTWFVDAFGNLIETYARGSRAWIRVEDHTFDRPGLYDTVQVTVRSLMTGDQENVTLLETARDGGIFEGSLPLETSQYGQTYPNPGDGKLQSDANEQIEAIHTDWTGSTVSSDRALLGYASVEFIDPAGVTTFEVLEGGVARLRLFDVYSSPNNGPPGVTVKSRYANDQEYVTLTETSYQSHIFEGTIQLRSVAPGNGLNSNNVLETSTSGYPEYRGDELTASYGGGQAVAVTGPSRVQFIDGFSQAVSSFAVGDRVGVRVEDHNSDDPTVRGSLTVDVRSLSGEHETVTLTETGFDTNVYEGSIATQNGGPAGNNGVLNVQPGETIEAEHGNTTTPNPTVAQATMTGASVLFVDAAGQPASVYLEGSRAYVRVADLSANQSSSPDSLTVTLRTALGPDVEQLSLIETGGATGVFTGSIPLSVSGGLSPNDGRLTTAQDLGTPHEFDTIRAEYNGAVANIATISSRTWFVDAFGNLIETYARGSRAYIRVEDHTFDRPGLYDTVQVTVRSLLTGDQENVTLLETARDGGIFEGSLPLETSQYGQTYPNPGDGKLQSDANEQIEAVHTDWTGSTVSSDQALLGYASVEFIDTAGVTTFEVLEGGVARLRLFDVYSNPNSSPPGVTVKSRYGNDQEYVTLTETSYQSHVFEGTIQLSSVAPGNGLNSNNVLETSSSGYPEYRGDELTASYGGGQAVAVTRPSRVQFIDGFGRVTSSFAVGDPAGVRVEDHNLEDPSVRRTLTVSVRSLAGEGETVTLTETGFDTNVYEGSIATQNGGPSSGNGVLQVQPGDTIEAEHANMTTPNPTVAQATMTGASVLFVDAEGRPAETYLEASRAYVRVTDHSASSVTVTVESVLGGDSESLALSQTSPSVFEGSVPLRLWPSVEPNSGYVETRQDDGPPHEYETLRVTYQSSAGIVTDTAGTIGSRTWFVDAFGNLADSYARGSRAYIRVEDHAFERPGLYDTLQATVRSLRTGDQETVTLLETTRDSGIFEGSLPLDVSLNGQTYPNPGDGKLQSDANEEIEAVHDDGANSSIHSSDRALIGYASVEFMDEAGRTTFEVLEGGVARLRVFDPYGNYGPIGATVRSRYGNDQEYVVLTETSFQSHVFEGTIELRSVAPGNALSSNNILETSTSGYPEYRGEELTASYGGDTAQAVTLPSRVRFIDGFGRAVSTFAVGDRAGVRVEDNNLDDPTVRRSLTVHVRSLSGEGEYVDLTETGFDTNVYEGSIATRNGGPASGISGNGALDVQPGERIEAEHANQFTPNPTVAQATMAGASVVFLDAQGRPAEIYLESTRAYVRVTDLYASSVTVRVESVLGGDSETLALSQTAPAVFEGSIPLRQWPSVEPNGGYIETRPDNGPPQEFDSLRVTYQSSSGVVTDTAGTIGSRTWFLDAFGNLADSYARNSRAYIRVEDHSFDRPALYDTVQVTVRSLLTGDQETLTLLETARSSGIFQGSLPLDSALNGQTYPSPGDGKLQSTANEEIEASHDDSSGATASSDRALIGYSSIDFVDEAGVTTFEVLEGGVARLRVFEPYGSSGPIGATVRSRYGNDQEYVALTETSYQSHVFQGTIELRSVAPGNGLPSNNILETSTSGYPAYLGDELTASYGGDTARAVTLPSRVRFIDAFGRATSTFAVGDRARVRVEDNNLDDPTVRRNVTVHVRSLAGEGETVDLTETGFDTNVYEGSIATQNGTPSSGNGALDVQPGETIEAEHANQFTPNPTVARAMMTGASVLFLDAAGQPAEAYLEASRAYVRVTDVNASGSVTVTVQSLQGGDSETLVLSQTAPSVFEGSIPMRQYPSVDPNSGFIETRQDYNPPHDYDTLKVTHLSSSGSVTDTVGTIGSRTSFVDAAGHPAESYAAGSAAYLRVEFPSDDQPGVSNTVQVTVRSLSTGDVETLTIQEIGLDGGVFQGSLPLQNASTPAANDGRLQSQPNEEIEAVFAEWGGVHTTSDRARILYSSIDFVDAAGTVTAEVLEGGVARLRVFDVNGSGSIGATVRSRYGNDQESVTLTETAYQSHIYEGTFQLRSVAPGNGLSSNNILETSTSGFPEYRQDEVTASYGGDEALAVTVPSRAWFVNLQGQIVTEYAVGSAVRVRVEDHNASGTGQIVTANLTTPGDSESLTLTETGTGTGLFEGSIPSSGGAPVANDGTLQAAPGMTVTAAHGNNNTPSPTRAQAVFTNNYTPLAVDDAAQTQEAPVTIAVLANDSDPDGEPLQVASVTQGAHGTVAVNAGQTVTYTPAAGFLGTDTFTYVASDPRGGQARATVTVTVISSNGPPTPANDSATTPEDTAVNIPVLANDTDPDGDALQIVNVSLPGVPGSGTAVLQPNNSVTFTPVAGWNGQTSFSYTVQDPDGLTATATVTVTVTPVNDALTAVDDTATTEEDAPVNVAVLANDSDPDNDTLSVSAVTQGTNGSVSIVGTQVRYTPNANFHGTDSFTYTASDGNGSTGTATVTVTVSSVNDAPAANDDNTTVAEDSSVSVTVKANDTDADGDTLDVTVMTQGAHGEVVLNADDTVTYTPNANFHGSDSFTYTLTDGNGGTDTATVSVTVTSANDAPTATDDTATVAEDTPVTVSVLANDTDVDNDTLTVSAVTQGTNGSVAILGGIGEGVTYTPNANFHGTDSFTYTANDGNGGTDTATVTVTINLTNDAPVADDDAASVVEDDSAAVAVLGNDSDVDGDSLTITAVTQGAHGTVSITGSTITYTPAPNYNGADAFTYTISDGNGGTDTATVSMTVTASNDALTANNDAATVVEDGSVTVAVLANDTDPENDPLTVVSVTQGTNGAVAIVGNQVTYTPNADFNGTDSFTYTASDGNGGTGGATVTVTVTPVNDAPVAGDDTASVVEDGSVTISVLGDDTDVDGDTLTLSAVTQGTNGTVAIVGSNQVTYTPATNFHGTDSFTYTVSDGNGGTDTANVTVTVGAANDAPVANGDSATTAEDTAVSISVLANDTDLDGDTLSVASVTQGANGAVTISGTQVVYTPGANFHGSDSFTYTVSDGNGGSATATVAVTITPVNDAPVAGSDTATVAEDGSVTISVRSNDTDVDGDTLAITAVTQGAHGSVTHNGNTVAYTPAANYNGPDAFTYTIADGHGGTAVGTVTVNVTGTNDAPVAVNDSATVAEDGSVVVSVRSNDSDLDGDTLTITAVTQGAHGSVTHNGSTVTYTPAANYNGSDSFTYTISDGTGGGGGTATASVAITVTPVNDPPVAVNDAATTLAEVAVTVNVRANDSDIDSPTLTVTAVTQGAHGSVSINAGATVTYTPATGWVGPDSFTYTISDGAGGTATATVNVTVQAAARVTGNLQVLYTFYEGSGTLVHDVSGVGTPYNLTIGSASAVTWLPGALSFNSPVLVQSAATATKVINACKTSNEVTMEAWVAPDNTTQTGPAAIASIGQNTTKRDVTLGQSGTAYTGQLKTSTTGNDGTQTSSSAVATTGLTHVVYTRSSTGAVRIYVNGTQVASSTLTGNLAGWTNYGLALGGEPNGARYWLGDMHLVAIYSRALTAAEARQNWLAGAN